MSLPLQIAASQGARRRGRGMLGQRLFFQAQEDAARLQTQADTGLDPNGALFRKLSDDRGRFPLPGDWTVGLGAKVQRDDQAQRDVSIARTFLGEEGRRRVAPTVTERRQATPGTLEFVMKSVDRGLKLTPEDRSLVDSVLTARGLVFDEQALIQTPGFNDRNVKPTERAGSLIRVRNDDVVDVLNQIRKPEGRAALMAEVAGFRQLRAQASAAAHVDNTIFDQAPFTYESLMRSRRHGTSAVELRDGKLMPMAEALQVANELQWPVQPVKQLSDEEQALELAPTHKPSGYDQIRYGDGKDIRRWIEGRFQRSMQEGGKAVGHAIEHMFPSFSGLAIDLDADKVANVGKLAMTTLPGLVTGAFLNSSVGKDVVKGMNGQKVSDLVGGLIGGLPAGAVQAVPMAMSNLDYAADPKNPAFDRAMALAEGLGNLDFASGNQLGALGMKAGSRVTQAVRAALARDMQIPVELIDEAFARAAQQAHEARGTGLAETAPVGQPNKSLSSVGDGTPLPAGGQVVKEHDAAAKSTTIGGIQDFHRGLVEHFGLPDEQAGAVTAVLEARARAHSRVYGGTPEDYVASRVGEIRSGDQQGLIDRHGVDPQGKKGAHELLADGRSVIHALENPDISTAVHELWHVFQKDLDAADSAIVSQQHALYQQQHQQQFGSLDNALSDREYFARQGERYLRDGKTSLAPMRAIFEKFKSWMSEVYAQLKGSPIDAKVSKEMRQLFDRMLDAEGKPSRNGNRVVSNGKIYDLNPEQITAHENLTNEYIGRRDLLEEELKGARSEDERNDIEYELAKLQKEFEADKENLLSGAKQPQSLWDVNFQPNMEKKVDLTAAQMLAKVQSGGADGTWTGLRKITPEEGAMLGELSDELADIGGFHVNLRSSNAQHILKRHVPDHLSIEEAGRLREVLSEATAVRKLQGGSGSRFEIRGRSGQVTVVQVNRGNKTIDVVTTYKGPADQLPGSDFSAPGRTPESELATGPDSIVPNKSEGSQTMDLAARANDPNPAETLGASGTPETLVPTDRGQADHLPASREPAPMETGPEGTVPKPDFQEDPFYHKSERVLDEKMRGPMLAQDVSRLLENSGVKADELKWTGLDQWLRDRMGVKVTPDDVRQYIEANKVQVREVVKSLQPVNWERVGDSWMYDGNRITRLPNGRYAVRSSSGMTDTFPTLESAKAQFGPGKGDTKYSSYQAPGGENYREVLLTVPEATRGRAAVKGESYQGPHWDEPNVVAHMRVSDRTIDGKRTLFLDEVQSDWHQAARQGKDVPDGPFRNSWHELTMRRAMRYAAENGYDAIAWTTGDAQALRYSQTLQEGVDMMRVAKRGEGQYEILARGKSGRDIVDDVVDDQQLREMLGGAMYKDAKAAFDAGKPDWSASGENLKIGGHGMREFYDGILPRFMSKEGKKWGASVETRAMETPAGMVDVHAVDVTPEMRRSVLQEGQVLFQDGEVPKDMPELKYVLEPAKTLNERKALREHRRAKKSAGLIGNVFDHLEAVAEPGTPRHEAAKELGRELDQTLNFIDGHTTRLVSALKGAAESAFGKGFDVLPAKRAALDEIARLVNEGDVWRDAAGKVVERDAEGAVRTAPRDRMTPEQQQVYDKWVEINRSLVQVSQRLGIKVDDVVRLNNNRKLLNERIGFYASSGEAGGMEVEGVVVGVEKGAIIVRKDGSRNGQPRLERLPLGTPFSRRTLVEPEYFFPLKVKQEVYDAISRGRGELYDRVVQAVKEDMAAKDGTGRKPEDIPNDEAEQILTRSTDPNYFTQPTLGKLARLERPRLPVRLPADLYDNSFYAMAKSHIQASIRRIEAAERWGHNYGRAMATVSQLTHDPSEAQALVEMIKGAMGESAPLTQSDREFRAKLSVLGAYEAVSKLTGFTTAVMQLGATANAAGQLGFKAYAKGLMQATMNLENGWGRMADIRMSGAVSPDLVSLMGMKDAHELARQIADVALTVTGVKPVDTALRYHAALTGRVAVEDALRSLKKESAVTGGKAVVPRNANYRLLADWFHYTHDDIERMLASGLSEKDIVTAYHGGAKTQMRSRAADLPKEFSSPVMKTLFMFNTFNIQQGKFLAQLVKEGKRGNWAPLGRTLVASAALFAVPEAKKMVQAWLSNKEPAPPPDDLVTRVMMDVTNGGLLGMYGLSLSDGWASDLEEPDTRMKVLTDLLNRTANIVSPPLLREAKYLGDAVKFAQKTTSPAEPAPWVAEMLGRTTDEFFQKSFIWYGRARKWGDDDRAAVLRQRSKYRDMLEKAGFTDGDIDKYIDRQFPMPAPRGATSQYKTFQELVKANMASGMGRDAARETAIDTFGGRAPKKFAGEKDKRAATLPSGSLE